MLRRWQVSDFNKYVVLGLIFLVIASTIFSCTVPKKYQKDKPFIYKTDVELNTDELSNAQKLDLKDRLVNQIDDSLKVRTVVASLNQVDIGLLPCSKIGECIDGLEIVA